MQKELKIIMDAYKKIIKETSTVPSLDDIARATNIPAERVKEILSEHSIIKAKWWKGRYSDNPN